MSDRRDPAVEHLADALDRGLKRAQDAIERAAKRHADVLERVAQHTGEPWIADLAKGNASQTWARQRDAFLWKIRASREERREARRMAKHQAKLERKLANARLHAEREKLQLERKTVGEGIVGVGAALAMVGTAVFNHDLWWMVFPAFGIGSWGARILSAKLSRPRELGPAPEREEQRTPIADPRDARVDAVCTKILAELKNAPASLKELIGKSDKTIEQLRSTCRSLTARERELRALVNPDDDARLERERDQLQQRITREQDEVARARFRSALEALENQRKERAQLVTAAARFEAEHTRIAYTLEGLYTQILRLKSADSAAHDPASAALRQSLAQLGEEMDAVADAMESVNRSDVSAVVPVESADPASRGRERERS